jgi:retinol dehydrogenase-12
MYPAEIIHPTVAIRCDMRQVLAFPSIFPPIFCRMFSRSSTAEQVADHFSKECKDKVIIVTGSNTGLGLETARVLALNGAKVILSCRNKEKGLAAVDKIKSTVPNALVEFMSLDLASLKSIREFSSQFLATHPRLDILINNAGIMACPKSYTADGFEMQFGVNHLGHFYLTNLLLDRLKESGRPESPSRVVNVSSLANFIVGPAQGILFDDIQGDKYNAWERYGNSKLANIMFTNELSKRCQGQNVISVSLHPGSIHTELARHLGFRAFMGMFGVLQKGSFSRMIKEWPKSIPQGAATTVLASLDPSIENAGYYFDCANSNGQAMHPHARDEDMAAKLWEFSEKLISSKSS